MLERVKTKLNAIKEENIAKREERTRIAREQAEEEERKENARIQAEKDALMALSEKELMVEAIMALKGYNTRLTIIEKQQSYMNGRISSLESDVAVLEDSVYDLENRESGV